MPEGGLPLYEVAAAFMKAAGWKKMTDDVIKYRLEAQKRALRKQGA